MFALPKLICALALERIIEIHLRLPRPNSDLQEGRLPGQIGSDRLTRVVAISPSGKRTIGIVACPDSWQPQADRTCQ